MRIAPPAMITLTTACLTGCESERSVRVGHTVRDSAGISIVENGGPAWDNVNRWRISQNARVTIGTMAGDPVYELFRPRAAFRLSDGRIVVGNNGTLQVRFYDSSGMHLMDIGGRGGGPGEFRRLDRVFRTADDSIVVYDQPQRRITVFDPSGAYVRDISLDQSDRTFFPSSAVALQTDRTSVRYDSDERTRNCRAVS